MNRVILLDTLLWAGIYAGFYLDIEPLTAFVPAILVMLAIIGGGMAVTWWFWCPLGVEEMILERPEWCWARLWLSSIAKSLVIVYSGQPHVGIVWFIAGSCAYLLVFKVHRDDNETGFHLK